MKKFFILSAIAFLQGLNAQVGVDTESPKATLDVMATTTDTAKPDGIIAPRLTGAELKAKDAAYGADQNGTIVYATTALDSNTSTTKTELVTEAGYYYYDHADGAKWKPFYKEPWNIAATTEKATAIDQNIYRMGKVAIGRDLPGAAGRLMVWNNTSELGALQQNISYIPSTEQPNTGSTGIQVSMNDNSAQPLPPSTNSGYSLRGISLSIEDNSILGRSITGMGSSIDLGIGRNQSGYDIRGIASSVNLINTNTTVETKNLIGIENDVAVYYKAGTFRNMFGLYSDLGAIPTNGETLTVDNITNIWSHTRFDGGTRGQSLSSGPANINVDILYGLLVDREDNINRDLNIIESYGLYIGEFLFNGADAANAYNFYSEGTTTKNVFEGKVGIGTTAQTNTRLHVIKDASDITPVIVEGLPVFEDNSAASSLPNGALYRTSTGVLRVKY